MTIELQKTTGSPVLNQIVLLRPIVLTEDSRYYYRLTTDHLIHLQHLTKQTTALREVNDTRLRMYENIEISISDLERSNHRLMIENSNDKKHIKT